MKYKILNIHDDILQDEFHYRLDKDIEKGKWMFDCTGGTKKTYPDDAKRDYRFWGLTMWRRERYDMNFVNVDHIPTTEALMGFLKYYNQKYVPEINLVPNMLHCNGQTVGQNGKGHRDVYNDDFKNYTLMLMINTKWEKEWGGQFEILDKEKGNPKVVKTIDYKPGRVIFFDGSIPHRGIGPTIPDILRKTLVFKCIDPNRK